MSALSETAKLVSSLDLKDNFTPTANRAMKSLGKMESTAFRVGQGIGKGFNNAAHNLKRIAQVGVVALTGAVALGVRSLGDLARAQAQTNAVIKSTKGAAGVSAVEVRRMAESLEDLTTIDDKVIQDGENLLLTFTKIGGKTFPVATKAMVDMATALAGGNVEQIDLKKTAIQLGKALQNPTKGIAALTRSGVTFSDKQQKRIKQLQKEGKLYEAQAIILREVNREFGEAGKAAGTGPEAVMRRLEDAGEDLSQVLARGTLPVLERFGKFLTTKLADKGFLDKVDAFGIKLGEAGGKFLDFIERVDFGAIGSALSVAAGAAGTLVGWFMQMPDWVKTAVLTGWGLNKLTGGALTGIIKELAGGLVGGLIHNVPGVGKAAVQPVFVTNMPAGGLGTGVAGAAGAAGAGGLSGIIGTALKALGVVSLAGFASEFGPQLNTFAIDLRNQIAPNFPKISVSDLSWPFGPKDTPKILPEIFGGNGLLGGKGSAPKSDNSTTTAEGVKGNVFGTKGLAQSITDAQRAAGEKVTTSVENLKGQVATDLAAAKGAIDTAGTIGSAASTGAGRVAANASTMAGYTVAAAVRSSVPTVITNVHVTGATVVAKDTVIKRAGPNQSDRTRDGGDSGGGAGGQ